jgi:hypothetical protein
MGAASFLVPNASQIAAWFSFNVTFSPWNVTRATGCVLSSFGNSAKCLVAAKIFHKQQITTDHKRVLFSTNIDRKYVQVSENASDMPSGALRPSISSEDIFQLNSLTREKSFQEFWKIKSNNKTSIHSGTKTQTFLK